MEPEDRARAMAEHMFTRTMLHDIIVELCMVAPDPIGEAQKRASLKLAAADNVTDKNASRVLLNHHFLHQMETFWEGVQSEVRARVDRERGVPRKRRPLPPNAP